MIQANHIHMGKKAAQPVNPPAIPRGTKCLPVVDGIAPQLPLRAEIVGRNTGNKERMSLFVEQEELRVCPHITRIRRNEERQVANQSHTLGMGVSLEFIGLTKQQKLCKADLVDL